MDGFSEEVKGNVNQTFNLLHKLDAFKVRFENFVQGK